MKSLGVMKNSYLSIVAFLILVFSFTNIYSQQESPCASSSCTANDFNLINFYLGDENGDPFGDGSCDPGPPPEEVDAHIWVEFSSTASASRYSLYLYFDVKLTDANGGITTSTETACLYLNEAIPYNGLLDIYTFMWDCGDEVELSNFYMSWQTSMSKPCGVTSSHCYCEPGPIIINAPLIPNFTSQAECVVGESIEHIIFNDATTGGLQPYTAYNWNFGIGATPATANTAGPHNVTYTTTGNKTVTLEITDSNGITLTEEKIITVGDANCCVLDMSCPPSFNEDITCSAALPDPATSISELKALGFTVSSTCGTIVITSSDSAIPECSGDVIRTYTILDDRNGNGVYDNGIDEQITCEQTFSINDNINPTASNLDPINVECDIDVPNPDINLVSGVSDNCTPNPTISWVSDISDDNTCPEVVTRTYSVTDDCNNQILVTQTITINDTTAPVIAAAPADISVQCIDDVPEMIDLAYTDNCDANGSVTGIDSVLDGNACRGTITRTWNISDNCGNAATQVSQIITINDDTAPVIAAAPADITVQCMDDVPEMIDLAYTDNCDANGSVTGIDSVLDGNACGGTITRTWNISDNCGNAATQVSQIITINDDTAPNVTSCSLDNSILECLDSASNEAAADNWNANNIALIEACATDNCDTDLTIISDYDYANLNTVCGPCGTLSVNYTITDECGNQSFLNALLSFDDITIPDLSNCNVNSLNLECDGANNETVANQWNLDNITALEACAQDLNITVTSNYSWNDFNVSCGLSGNLPVTYTVTDDCDNSAFLNVTITFTDTTDPTFNEQLPQDVTVECDNVPVVIVLTADDSCDNDITVNFNESITNQNDDCANNYTITRVWTVTDCAGNDSSHTQIITVEDITAPTFDVSSLPQDVTLECSDNIPNLEDIILTATDNCSDVSDIIITPSEVITNQDDECSNNYTVTRTWIANDCAGNSIEHVQVITVVDSSAPVLSALPANATVECDSIPNADVLTATDNCDLTLDVNFDEQIVADPNGCATNYTIHRTWTVTDCAGNTTEHVQVITVEDNSVPVLSGDIPVDVTVECDGIPEAAILTVEDNCGNNIPIAFTEVLTENDDECANNYIMTRTWTVTDCAGNSTQHVQIITVEDNTAPTFDVSSLPQNVTLECSDNIPNLEDAVVTATDNCSDVSDIIITPSEEITNQDDDCSNNYTITRTWIANDCAGNSIEHVQIITVVDNTAPVFDVSSLPQDVTLECSDNIPNLEDVILTATDNCADVSDIIITPSEIFTNQDDDCSNNYTITRTWVANDCAGNSIEHVQVITVVDNTAPVFDVSSLPQDVTLECSDNIPNLEDVILTATDNCSDVSDIIITPSEVITNQDDDCSNNYTITRTWVANDCAGNSIEHVQVITVEDNTAPVFDVSSLPQDVTLECSDPVPALENVILTATDNCSDVSDIIITPSEEITNQDSECSNNYTITRTWVANDCAGNTIEHVQTITIVDTTLPILSEGYDGSAECTGTDPSLNEEYIIWRDDFADITATDNCGDATLSVTEGQWVQEGCSYTMTINVIATDECGLVSEAQERTFIISDTTAPEILTYLEDIVFYCNEVPPVPEIDIEENCSEATVVFTETTIGTEGSEDYQIIRTWTISDDCGNETIKEQVLLVEPSCDCLEDKFITKAITPNGDIYNDYFKVEGIDDCGIPSLKIFNRWGALVYQSDNYDSKKGRWRGTSQGGVTIGGNNELPTGTYYYIIEIRNSDIKPITGHVYLSTK
jgi:gliding motility-associated-like protein